MGDMSELGIHRTVIVSEAPRDHRANPTFELSFNTIVSGKWVQAWRWVEAGVQPRTHVKADAVVAVSGIDITPDLYEALRWLRTVSDLCEKRFVRENPD